MKEQLQYVDFDTAVLLKEVGFDYPCRYYWGKNFDKKVCEGFDGELENYNGVEFGDDYNSRPSLSKAAQWLREVKGLHIFVNIFVGHIEWNYIINDVLIARCENQMVSKDSYDSHDLALSSGITKALELLKNSNK